MTHDARELNCGPQVFIDHPSALKAGDWIVTLGDVVTGRGATMEAAIKDAGWRGWTNAMVVKRVMSDGLVLHD